MGKRLVQISNASKSNYLDNWDMHIAQQSLWRKKLEERDENINFTYFEKHYDQTFPIYFSTSDTVCMQLQRATTRDVIHIYK